jgi:DNA repair exonuclease SbcCD ATPase subunit
MNIKIITLRIEAFKGLKDISWDFSQNKNTFQGRNAVGKTTIADAWQWLITGKDMAGASDTGKGAFNAIPIGEESAKVTALIEIDGQSLEIGRGLSFVKDSASKKSSFYIEDTEVQQKKYNEIIAQYFGDDPRLLMVPGEFLNRDWKEQRALLTAGLNVGIDGLGIEIHESDKKEIATLGLDEFEKAKKKGIKDNKDILTAIPKERERVQSLMPQPRDYAAIEAELKNLQEATPAKKEMPQEYHDLQQQKKQIFADYTAANNAYLKDVADAEAEIAGIKQQCQKEVEEAKRTAQTYNELAAGNAATLEAKQQQIAELRKKFEAERAKEFVNTDDGAITCPLDATITCDNAILHANREEASKKAAACFMKQKNETLTKYNQEGAELKKFIEELTATIKQQENTADTAAEQATTIAAAFAGKIEEAKNRLATITAQQPKMPDTTDIDKRLAEIESANATGDDTERVKKIAELSAQLAEKAQAEKLTKALADIEANKTTAQNNLTKYETAVAMVQDIRRQQAKTLEKEVNKHFADGMSFKLFEEQVNGTMVEACNLYLNCCQYGKNANTAAEINAEIQIIGFLQSLKDKRLPVFVDNTESVNELTTIPTQMVALKVTEDNEITML